MVALNGGTWDDLGIPGMTVVMGIGYLKVLLST